VSSWHPIIEWRTSTPGGRELVIRHDGDLWLVRSGEISAESRSLDLALIDVVCTEDEVEAHKLTDYATWVREQAADIEGSLPQES
jgi:hypothetical protein